MPDVAPVMQTNLDEKKRFRLNEQRWDIDLEIILIIHVISF